jgi:hypothetical protein
MSSVIFLTTVCLILGTVLLVFGMKYLSSAFAARARLQGDEAYRSLAERAQTGQAETQTALAALQAELAKVSANVAAVEKILKQVE